VRSFLALLVLTAALGASAPVAGAADVRADFNGDGYGDLAVGVPKEDVLGVEDAGGVNVLYGSEGGLSDAGNRFWTLLDSPDRSLEEGAEFGTALATGDFDGDGFADLAVGAPNWDLREVNRATPIEDAGAVVVLYGRSGVGLLRARNQLFFQAGRQRDYRHDYWFGSALAVGDFDGDGFDDLAVGMPGWSVSITFTRPRSGGVVVLHGSRRGLTNTGRQLWTQDTSGVRERAEEDDRFGEVLAAGDFNGDGDDDLAIGVPHEDSNAGPAEVGAVNVLYGTDQGLTAVGDQVWSQYNVGAGESAEYGDTFGDALAVGDFDGDDFADLAIGVPYEDVHDEFVPLDYVGAVDVLYGTPGGLAGAGAQSLKGWYEHGYSGSALAAGDFDGDEIDDLAVGAPAFGAPRYFSDETQGQAIVWFGSDGRFQTEVGATERLFVHPSQSAAQPDAEFGAALAAGDFDGNGLADLVIGARDYDVPILHGVVNVSDAGAVFVLAGGERLRSPPGERVAPDLRLFQRGEGAVADYQVADIQVADVAEKSDGFGSVLAG